MKKYELNLAEYEITYAKPVIENGKPVIEDGKQKTESITEVYPLKDNISSWLRTVGLFRTGEEITEAALLAKQVRDSLEPIIVLDEREKEILKKTINRFLDLTIEGKANLGGPNHEEAIIRIFSMQEVK